MNNDIIAGKWDEIKSKIKTKWAEFTDDDLDQVKGDFGQLRGKLQQTYGYAKDDAQRQYDEFINSIEPSQTAGSEPAAGRLNRPDMSNRPANS